MNFVHQFYERRPLVSQHPRRPGYMLQDIKSCAKVKEVISERNRFAGKVGLPDVPREIAPDVDTINITRPKGIANIGTAAEVQRLGRPY